MHSVEVHGHYLLGGAKVRFRYWYEAPDRYEGLMDDDAEKLTFFAIAESRTILYDPHQGELLVFTDTLPGIRGIIQNNILYVGCSFSAKNANASTPPESSGSAALAGSGVLIDLPSMLGGRTSQVANCGRRTTANTDLLSFPKPGPPLPQPSIRLHVVPARTWT